MKKSDRWYVYWNAAPDKFEENDMLRQVGKTVNGQPISKEQVQIIIDDLSINLRLQSSDNVIDLCCGNGLIARLLIEQNRCGSVIGVDYSAPLIKIAKQNGIMNKTYYILSSIGDRDWQKNLNGKKYSKVFMCEALQHFSYQEFNQVLFNLADIFERGAIFYIASIPDKSCLDMFYNTPDRRQEYKRRVMAGNEAIGTWWTIEELSELAGDHGFRCQIISQPQHLYTAHYRFNAILTYVGR